MNLKLHMVGEKNIPKIVDQIFDKISYNFDNLQVNKQFMMKIFHIFKYLPLNYNRSLFNRIHNYLKSVKDLSSHLLIFLPYNKLSVNEITFLENKMFASGR